MFSSSSKQKVQYFGLWAEECRDQEMAKAALSILWQSIEHSIDDDVRSDELDAVLSYVEGRSIRKDPVRRFRDATSVPHPLERKAAMSDAYVRIARELGLYNGRL